jgi:4-hydroxybenzoate polyprenyltransferase
MSGRAAGRWSALRTEQWWGYKLPPMLAAAYATAWMLEVPVSAVWSALVLALVAVIPCAAYVSVINDLTDRHDDATAGKANRLTDQPRAVVALLLIGTIAPAVVLLWYWWSDPLLRWTYACVWIAFSLYSIPPARLKHRGFAGVLADASGAHLFPTLLFVLLIFRGAERPVDPIWLGAVGIWSLCDGLRGILWHQLGDREGDRTSGARTFAARYSRRAVEGLGTRVVFPLELAALVLVLWRGRNLPGVAALVPYLALVGRRWQRRRTPLVVVSPRTGSYRIAMYEYYEFFLPVGLLVASALRHPADVIVLAAHLALFPGRMLDLWHEHAVRLVRRRA